MAMVSVGQPMNTKVFIPTGTGNTATVQGESGMESTKASSSGGSPGTTSIS